MFGRLCRGEFFTPHFQGTRCVYLPRGTLPIALVGTTVAHGDRWMPAGVVPVVRRPMYLMMPRPIPRRAGVFGRAGSSSVCALFVFLQLACASDDSMDEASSGGATGPGAPSMDGGFDEDSRGTGADAEGGAFDDGPPESEVESAFRAPVSTGRYIWSANPDTGRVAMVDAETLQIELFDAGFRPTQVAGIPGEGKAETAIVLNEGSRDATLLSVSKGSLTEKSFALHASAKHWVVSKEGGWAIAWTDSLQYSNADPLDGFQDVTAIDLEAGDTTRLSVGYRPSRWFFSDDETQAFAVTEDGISVLGLAGKGLGADSNELIRLGSKIPVAYPDVTVTGDGKYALYLRDRGSVVRVLHLRTDGVTEVELSGPVTDLDLAQNGEFAVAVIRSRAEVVILPVPEIVSYPDVREEIHVPGETFGSAVVSEDGSLIVAYTNATPNSRVTLIRLDAFGAVWDTRTVDLKAPVLSAFPATDGSHVITLMGVPEGSTKQGAFALVPADGTIAPKIVGTSSVPQQVAMAPSSSGALVSVANPAGDYGVYVVRAESQRVDFVELPSRPLATGMVETIGVERGYVAQEHPEGRITLVELQSGEVRTLTGFELAAKVVDGS